MNLSKWRQAILSRDDYRCVDCGADSPLHAHHIKPKHEFPELIFAADNGKTLCKSCHAKAHGVDFSSLILFTWAGKPRPKKLESDFSRAIKSAGVTKSELGRRLGITPNGISKWGDSPPQYAVAYLELLIEYNRVRP